MQTAPTATSHQLRQRGQGQPGDPGDGEGERRARPAPAAAWPRRSRPAASGRPGRRRCRAAVGVVVGVVDRDLQRERDDEREQRRDPGRKPSSAAAAPVPTSTGATAAGSVRGRAPASHWAGVAIDLRLLGAIVRSCSARRPIGLPTCAAVGLAGVQERDLGDDVQLPRGRAAAEPVGDPRAEVGELGARPPPGRRRRPPAGPTRRRRGRRRRRRRRRGARAAPPRPRPAPR